MAKEKDAIPIITGFSQLVNFARSPAIIAADIG